MASKHMRRILAGDLSCKNSAKVAPAFFWQWHCPWFILEILDELMECAEIAALLTAKDTIVSN